MNGSCSENLMQGTGLSTEDGEAWGGMTVEWWAGAGAGRVPKPLVRTARGNSQAVGSMGQLSAHPRGSLADRTEGGTRLDTGKPPEKPACSWSWERRGD